jgi:hypothetical protein
MFSTSELVNLIIRFTCFLAGFWLLWKINYCSTDREPKSVSDSDKKKDILVSIIIPARNEEYNLPVILDSLRKQTLKAFEIIVVDDNSRDETGRAEYTHLFAMLPAPIFFIWNPWWGGIIMIIYAVIINVPCIIAQRYNRARLEVILDNMKRKELNQGNKFQ